MVIILQNQWLRSVRQKRAATRDHRVIDISVLATHGKAYHYRYNLRCHQGTLMLRGERLTCHSTPTNRCMCQILPNDCPITQLLLFPEAWRRLQSSSAHRGFLSRTAAPAPQHKCFQTMVATLQQSSRWDGAPLSAQSSCAWYIKSLAVPSVILQNTSLLYHIMM